jgi:hypothetical protein
LTRLEKLARDKHSSLLIKFGNYGQKSFIALGPTPIKISKNSTMSILALASIQGILTEEEDSVQLTSSLRRLVFEKKVLKTISI